MLQVLLRGLSKRFIPSFQIAHSVLRNKPFRIAKRYFSQCVRDNADRSEYVFRTSIILLSNVRGNGGTQQNDHFHEKINKKTFDFRIYFFTLQTE